MIFFKILVRARSENILEELCVWKNIALLIFNKIVRHKVACAMQYIARDIKIVR